VALSPAQELLEHQLRVSQMLTNIPQMETNIKKMHQDMHNEVWKIGISLIVGAAACVGAGAAVMNYLDRHYIAAPIQQQGKT
jgi:uncharacterized membrane protein YfcA